MRLKTFYLNMSIKYKIVLFFYFVIILLSIPIGFYSYYIAKNNILNEARTSNLGAVRQIDSNINQLQKEIENTSLAFIAFDDMQAFLKELNESSTSTSGQYFYYQNKTFSFLARYLSLQSYLSNIILYNNNNHPYVFLNTDSYSGINDLTDVNESSVYNTVKQADGKAVWVSIDTEKPVFFQSIMNPKVAFCRIIKDSYTDENIGFLVICIDKKIINQFYFKSMKNNDGSILVLNSDGGTIASKGQNYFENNALPGQVIKKMLGKEGSFVYSHANGDFLVVYSTQNAGNWKVIYTIPMNSLTKEIRSIKTFTFLIVLGFILLSLPLLIAISTLLTRPIKQLHSSMKNFQSGNFNESVEVKYKDEIGTLGEVYNDMVKNIRQLIENNYLLEIKNQESELNALQSQINPHFLYNTLELIYWEALEADQKKLAEMVICLSNLFRLSLSRGKQFILVSSEKNFISYYLTLQKMRYHEKLNYILDFDSSIMDFIIPKLVIQPFVENALYHGLEKKEGPGTIKVTGKLLDGKIVIIISDDGVGMDEETVNSLLTKKNPEGSNKSGFGSSYAIANVNDRLKLYYKGNSSISISSDAGTGTQVILMLPPYLASDDDKGEIYNDKTVTC